MIYEPTIILKPDMVNVHRTARVDAFCKLEGGNGLTIGVNVHVASFCHLNAGAGEVHLGAHSGYASHAVICGGMPDFSALPICPMEPDYAPIRKRTIIGEYAFIGAGAIVLPGVIVGYGAIVGAGAVVTKDVPPWGVIMGVPGRVVGLRKVGPDGKLRIIHWGFETPEPVYENSQYAMDEYLVSR